MGKELLDQLLQRCDDPQDLLAQGGFLRQLTGCLVERALEGEMTDHLGYEKHGGGKGSGNSRNGHFEPAIVTDVSPTPISDVTASVLDEVTAWQNRPLDRLYLIFYLDALFVRARHEGGRGGDPRTSRPDRHMGRLGLRPPPRPDR
ncbi:transposase [Rubrivirga sp.]|uniref:transposase n=1 Tax=Rubrivirga sp. TaxID=1885344 RepID=UPI003B529DDC